MSNIIHFDIMDLAEIRYIADGFRSDVESLLEEFSSLHTYDYRTFTEIWVERKFSLVFMGRENESELSEFTQEIFVITLSFIKRTHSSYLQTGAIYVLYSLYIKQPLEHKCKIRIVQEQWLEIMEIFNFAKKECIKHLLFAILKLISMKAFNFVSHKKLMGPKSTMTWELVSENTGNIRSLKRSLAGAMEFLDFKGLRDLHLKYEKMKPIAAKYGVDFDLAEDKYESIEEELQNFLKTETFESLNDGKDSPCTNSSDSIGIRRSELKMKQYQANCITKIANRTRELLDGSEEEDDVTDTICGPLSEVKIGMPLSAIKKKKPEKKRRRRPRKGDRRRGRPKKNPDPMKTEEEEIEAVADPLSQIQFGDEADVQAKPFEKPKRLRWHYDTIEKPGVVIKEETKR